MIQKKNQSSRAEQKMMDLNAELARQNQIKEEMAMKLRQMENEMGNTGLSLNKLKYKLYAIAINPGRRENLDGFHLIREK